MGEQQLEEVSKDGAEDDGALRAGFIASLKEAAAVVVERGEGSAVGVVEGRGR